MERSLQFSFLTVFIVVSLLISQMTYSSIGASRSIILQRAWNTPAEDNYTWSVPRPKAVPGIDSQKLWKDQTARLERVKAVCDRLNRSQSYDPRRSYTIRLLVDDENGVLFGYIPKVGCTTWKAVFRRISSAHRGNYFRKHWRLSQFDDAGREKRLREYKKVLFVRDPIVRVLSAYLSKFRNLQKLQRMWESMYGFRIRKRYHPDSWTLAVNKSLPREKRPFLNITLTEFIRFIVDSGVGIALHEISDHWLPQYLVSHVCEIGFDFIGKYERLATEAPFVLNWLGLTSVARFPDVHPSTAASSISTEFGKVPLMYIQALQRYYSTDFELFGYDPTDTVREIASDILHIDQFD